MTSARIFVVVLFWLLGACAEEATRLNVAGIDRQFFLLVGNQPSSADPFAYRLIGASVDELDAQGMAFCFADILTCRNGAAMSVATTKTTVQGGTVYIANKMVHLSPGLRITLMGRTNAGNPLAESVVIYERGQIGGLAPQGMIPSGLPTTPSGIGTLPTGPGTIPSGPSIGGLGQNDPTECRATGDEYQIEAEIARLVNQERQAVGLQALQYHPRIACVARLWSREQGRLGSISHTWFENGQWSSTYQSLFGESSPAMAENVAMSSCESDAAAVARSFMNMWMNSQGHKENILRQSVTTIGVGMARTSDGSCYGTQNFGN